MRPQTASAVHSSSRAEPCREPKILTKRQWSALSFIDRYNLTIFPVFHYKTLSEACCEASRRELLPHQSRRGNKQTTVQPHRRGRTSAQHSLPIRYKGQHMAISMCLMLISRIHLNSKTVADRSQRSVALLLFERRTWIEPLMSTQGRQQAAIHLHN